MSTFRQFNLSRSSCRHLIVFYVLASVSTAARGDTGELPVSALEFSPDGQLLAAAANANLPASPVILWRTADWSVQEVRAVSGGCLDVDFSADGKMLAYGTKTGDVGVIELDSGRVIAEFHLELAVLAVEFLALADRIAVSGDGGTISIFSLVDKRTVGALDGHQGRVYALAAPADRQLLWSGGADGVEQLWDLTTGKPRKKLPPSELIVRRISASPDGSFVLGSSYAGEVRIRDVQTGQLRAVLSGGSSSAAMAADNRLAVNSGRRSTAFVFHLDLGELSESQHQLAKSLIEKLRDDAYEVRLQASKELVGLGLPVEPMLRELANDADAEVRLRARRIRETILAAEPVAKLSGHQGDIEVVDVSRDGRWIATGCRSGEVRIWDAQTFEPFRQLNLSTAVEQYVETHK